MDAKVLYAGEGANIPGIEINLGLSFLKIWLGPPFRGYTSATNDFGKVALLDVAIVETPVVSIGDLDDEAAEAFSDLHGQKVTVKIDPNLFVRSGGIATINLTVHKNQDGGIVDKTISFVADNCRGISTGTELECTVEMLQLPEAEWTPGGSVIP